LLSLFSPKKLINGSIKPRGTTKVIIEELKLNKSLNITTTEAAIIEAVNTIERLKTRVKSIDKVIPSIDILSYQNELVRLSEGKKSDSPLIGLKNLREKISSERLQRDVLETILPMHGIISSTLHKLKGREFDYVGIVTVYDDKLRNASDSEKDARRLMYMALTRARYDARVLYIESHPCFLLHPYI
jgi:superfamily I DNA/RNA helicase